MADFNEDAFQHIKEITVTIQGVVVVVDFEGQGPTLTHPSPKVTFTTNPRTNDTLTINDIIIKFGSGLDVSIGVTAQVTAQNLVDFLNHDPRPITGVSASRTDNIVRLFWTTPELTLDSASAGFTVEGALFIEDPPLDEGTVIAPDDYSGLAIYDPFGNAGAFIAGTDIVHIIYGTVIASDPPDTHELSRNYLNRIHRSMLVNFKLAPPTMEVDVFAQNGNNYNLYSPFFGGPLYAVQVRLMQDIDQVITLSAYSDDTEFTIGSGGTITTDATPIWTDTKTITVGDVRGPPAANSGSIDAYNDVGDSPPTPFGTLRFNEAGVISVVVGSFGGGSP